MEQVFSEISESIVNLLTAELIVTPFEQLLICNPDDKISSILPIMKDENYDFALVDHGGTIENFVRKSVLESLDYSNPCALASKQIRSTQIISKEEKIERLLEVFTKEDFLVVKKDDKVLGMVTYADLNKRAVKVLFYIRITQFESLLLQHIGPRYDKEYQWRLHWKQRKRVREAFERTRRGNVDLNPFHFLEFRHLMKIVWKSEDLRERLGYNNNVKKARNELNRLADLRNDVMHGDRPLIGAREDVNELKEKYDLILKHAKKLSHTKKA